ncbi:hypothetical protein BDQ94DRAFT_143519 [Aspergillus welwitschiae]|uniref:Uncharacterized protein n=1 Tax=Aspergillus welwitschiae TaxID=1341132 RepID=A0A3F3Q3W1_9EURO|nr:hypothetical protein BDQ94DRAFT_143519 [Aspergillus welwitschiae]RDH33662.1 hypothetical protein BDQ94DRAFT_143519 [Aspergillus welwitschiae]
MFTERRYRVMYRANFDFLPEDLPLPIWGSCEDIALIPNSVHDPPSPGIPPNPPPSPA